MKSGVHPQDYRDALSYDSGAQQGWVIRSCAKTTQTMAWGDDGQEYPLFLLDTSSTSHPVYTGKQRNVNTEGRASKFNQRYGNIINKLKGKS